MERFGEKLHALRTKQGLSLSQLATALELKSRSYITELEKGRRIPSTPLLLKISLFFDVCADRLIRDDLELD